MTTRESILATAAHEVGHGLVARSFRAFFFAEVLPVPFHDPSTGEMISGLCHYDRKLSAFGRCASAWGGIMGQTLLGFFHEGAPPFTPCARTLELWCGAMLTRGVDYLSLEDQKQIFAYKVPLLGCRRAYKVLKPKLKQLKRVAELIARPHIEILDMQNNKEIEQAVATQGRARVLEEFLAKQPPNHPDRATWEEALLHLRQGRYVPPGLLERVLPAPEL